MIKKCLAICVVLVAAVNGSYGQARSKRVRQPREVVEAFRVCAEFRSMLANDFDFDGAFEATFTRDPARRRELAISRLNFGDRDLSQVDTSTLVEIYKHQSQLFVPFLPLMLASDERRAELFPPSIEEIFDDCVLIREGGEMRIIAYVLVKFRG